MQKRDGKREITAREERTSEKRDHNLQRDKKHPIKGMPGDWVKKKRII